MHTRGRRLAGDGVRSVTDRSLQKKHRRQAASYQTTCKPLKKLDFVGADLSAKRPVHPTHMRWLKYCIRGQVRSHLVCCATALRRRRGGASHKNVFIQQITFCLIRGGFRRSAGNRQHNACACGVSDALKGCCAAHRYLRNPHALRAEADFSASSAARFLTRSGMCSEGHINPVVMMR